MPIKGRTGPASSLPHSCFIVTIVQGVMVLGYMGDTKYAGKERIVVAMDIGTTQSTQLHIPSLALPN
jgi:hypothetical protein